MYHSMAENAKVLH